MGSRAPRAGSRVSVTPGGGVLWRGWRGRRELGGGMALETLGRLAVGEQEGVLARRCGGPGKLRETWGLQKTAGRGEAEGGAEAQGGRGPGVPSRGQRGLLLPPSQGEGKGPAPRRGRVVPPGEIAPQLLSQSSQTPSPQTKELTPGEGACLRCPGVQGWGVLSHSDPVSGTIPRAPRPRERWGRPS